MHHSRLRSNVSYRSFLFSPCLLVQLTERGTNYQVMYRQGEEGSELHEMCLEGISHAPLERCEWADVWFFARGYPPFNGRLPRELEFTEKHRGLRES